MKKEAEYISNVRTYFDNTLSILRTHLGTNPQIQVVTYCDALADTRAAILNENNVRLGDIVQCVIKYQKFTTLLTLKTASINTQYNDRLRVMEVVVQAHYQNCIDIGLDVEKVDFSRFKVTKDDGL
jgi:hypothetical protein